MSDSGAMAARMGMRRTFLWALIASLGAGALIAVLILLFGEFNETNVKILGTLAALAVHSGLAMVCSTTLDQRRWPRLSGVGLVVFAANFALVVVSIWWHDWYDAAPGRAVGTTAVLIVAYLLAVPCADLFERGRWRPAAGAGLAVNTLASAMTLVLVWAKGGENEPFVKTAAVMGLAAFTFAHMCLLLRVRGGPQLGRLMLGAIGVAWALAAWASVMIVLELEDELSFRLLGALGVIDAVATLGLVILTRIRGLGQADRLITAARQIELICPRCRAPQKLDVGKSKCTVCGLKFRIEVEEPRCPKCDYLLWQLTEPRCPECGTAVAVNMAVQAVAQAEP